MTVAGNERLGNCLSLFCADTLVLWGRASTPSSAKIVYKSTVSPTVAGFGETRYGSLGHWGSAQQRQAGSGLMDEQTQSYWKLESKDHDKKFDLSCSHESNGSLRTTAR